MAGSTVSKVNRGGPKRHRGALLTRSEASACGNPHVVVFATFPGAAPAYRSRPLAQEPSDPLALHQGVELALDTGQQGIVRLSEARDPFLE